MRFGPTHARSRAGRRRPGQGRPLPDEEEQDQRVRRLGHLHRRRHTSTSRWPTATRDVTFDNAIIATGATTRLLPGTSLSRPRRHLRGADPHRRAAGHDHHRRRRRDRRRVRLRADDYGVEVTIVEFLDRMVPPRTPTSPPSCQAVQEARHRGADLHPGRVDRRQRRHGQGHGQRPRAATSRCSRPTRCSRRSGSRRGSRATGWRRRGRADRARRHRRRRARAAPTSPHIYAIGDVTGEADARARGRGDGRGRGRDDRRRRDDGDRLRDDPAGDLLPAADRHLRLHRGAGARAGLRREGREVPVHRQRQGARAWPTRRLRQADRRRRARRAARRAPDRPRGHRAAAGADPGAAVGPHRRRDRPQRARPPDARRGAARRPSTASRAT